MAENPREHFVVHLHGPCVVCAVPLAPDDKSEIVLLRRTGAFPRFGSDNRMTVSKSSLVWLHGVHLG